MRIGFLFNHDQLHQVAHLAPVGLALARLSDAEIVFASTSPLLTAEIRRLAGDALGTRIQLVELGLKGGAGRLLSKALEPLLPARKLLVYRDNLDVFRSLDVLVVAEKTSLILKTRYGLDTLKIVHTRHGAGDRAVGFDPASARFDHVLVSGAKIRDRLVAEARLPPDKISIVGYPKFDLAPEPIPEAMRAAIRDDRPVVLYNPHASPHLSSWYRMGRQVLDWFARQDAYHLIFAPHVMLFERAVTLSIDRLRIDRPGRIAKRHLGAETIHVDLGSRACTTMAYTDRADIYLGDVSSQVYEFLRTPRPCVFLDAHGRTGWRDDKNFAHWHAGPVIGGVDALGDALARAQADQASVYAPIQRDLFAYSFDLDPAVSSSERAARAIARVAGLARS